MKKLILIFLLVLISTMTGVMIAYAATVPTGIPEPPFGLDETVANTVGSGDNDYYTHWVDNTDGGCSDSGNGTPETPRCTFPTMTGLAAGSVIQVRGGPYSMSSDIDITGTGTSGSPIFFRGPSYAGRITIDMNGSGSGGNAVDVDADYVIIENFEFTDQDEMFKPTGSNYISIRWNKIVGTNGTNDGSGTVIPAGGTTYLVTYYNDISYCGDWDNAVQNDMHALGTGASHSFTWHLYNTVSYMGGDGFGNSHNSNHTANDIYIGGNTFHHCRENCGDLKEIHDVVISENICHTITASADSSDGSGYVFHYGPDSGEGPYNIWMINNITYGCVFGVGFSNTESDHWFIGNLFYDISGAAFNNKNKSSGGELFLYHNTIVDNARGQYWGSALDDLTAAGNLSAYNSSYDIDAENSTVRSVAEYADGLYYNSVSFNWSTTYSSVSSWISGSGTGTGSIEQDPLFNDYSGNDFSITSGSPATNSGKDMSTIMSNYQTEWGVALNKDIAGTTRPSGVWDIGAYQAPAAATSKVGVGIGGALISIDGSILEIQ